MSPDSRRKKAEWSTGVTLADVNGDGLLDIYVCYAGKVDAENRANELYINKGVDPKGVPTFDEKAKEYGVADEGYSTQAAFFDYDRDGLLDLFVINNSSRPVSSLGMKNTRNVRDKDGGSRLYHNTGGHFVDVSEKAGIYGSEIGFGLGLVISDVNGDGWPDIYQSNDFFEHDYLYINNRNGTFTEALDREMPVSSYFSMGLDIADVNNDGSARHLHDGHAAGRRVQAPHYLQLRELGHLPGESKKRSWVSVHAQHASAEQRQRHVQRRRSDGRRSAHGLELERAHRRLRSRWPEGHLRNERSRARRDIAGLRRFPREQRDDEVGNSRPAGRFSRSHQGDDLHEAS